MNSREVIGLDHFNNYITVDLDIIKENFRIIQSIAGVPVMAIIKADAYGHGAVAAAKALNANFYGVSSLSEALELRNAGIHAPILILGQIPVCGFSHAVRLGIRPVIFHLEDARALSAEAVRQGKTAPFHFAVDTGMSRIGFQVTDADADTCAQIAQLPNLDCEGIFSHFATSDEADLSKARAQAAAYDRFCQMLEERGVQPRIRHLDNSAGIINFHNHYHMVRAGIILYGLLPSQYVPIEKLDLRPALSWHSRIAHLKTVDPGRQVSYGGDFTATRPTRIATVPVGYGDGYRRTLSGKFHVLIRGCKAPILGRVCMDQIMVDVTDIPGVCLNDPVTLLGQDGALKITAEEMGAAAGSFNYETVCAITRRVPRVYIQDGQILHSVNYLLD